MERDADLTRQVADIALLESKRDDAQNETEEAVLRYATQQCLPIMNALATKLPRELRDMVYSHLLPAGDVYVYPVGDRGVYFVHDEPKKSNARRLRRAISQSGISRSATARSAPAIFGKVPKQADDTCHWPLFYIGRHALLELMECWYGAKTFYLGEPEFRGQRNMLVELGRFLDADPWHLGVTATELVKDVCINIGHHYIYVDECHPLKSRLASDQRRVELISDMTRLADTNRLSPRISVQLYTEDLIKTRIEMSNQPIMHAGLEAFLPTLAFLRTRGWDVMLASSGLPDVDLLALHVVWCKLKEDATVDGLITALKYFLAVSSRVDNVSCNDADYKVKDGRTRCQ